KDIGEVQLAKAAIAAGIFLLMKRLEITEKDIKRVYLAGAFGNYMNPESAAAIGMFPAELLPRIQPVGNAAGEGARIALLNEEERKEMDRTVKNMDFVELAASPEFQDCFVDGLCFP
ncbi:ASKHA domain-containing protein, partial [Blautia massiliensis (ex Durand et al. 2017)]